MLLLHRCRLYLNSLQGFSSCGGVIAIILLEYLIYQGFITYEDVEEY